MNVVLIGQDASPSEAFEYLTVELKNRGHDPIVLVGKGKVFPASTLDISRAVKKANIVVIGMSSTAKLSALEISACEWAILYDKPFGFFGDTYNCFQRAATGSWFGPYNQLADFFFAINNGEACKARKVFTDLTSETSVATGNPNWENFAFPKFTRAEVRAKLGVTDDEIMVLSPGLKMAVHNILIWGLLIEALSGLPKSKLFLSCHPGDRAQFAVDPDNGNAPLNIYGDLKTHTTVSVEILLNNLKTSDVLPGADLVVCWNSGSISVEAAHQRIPVIALSTEIGRRRTFFESNSEKWEPVELGVALEVEANPFKLRDKITGLLGNRDHVRFDLQKRQAEVYPKSEQKGSAVRKMADALEKLVK